MNSGIGVGYNVLGSERQRECHNAASIARVMGREPSAIPRNLSRVLYIPSHGGSQFHLPLYDVSEEFKRAVGDAPLGSSMFTTKLALMEKPSGEGTDADVRYLVDVEKQPKGHGEQTIVRIRRRVLGDADDQANTISLVLNMGDDGFEIKRASSAGSGPSGTSVFASYPVPDTKLREGAVRHPYYSFCTPNSTEMQWQSHPVAHGPLRNTLVRTKKLSRPDSDELPSDDAVEAIYHHIGINTLDLCHWASEGVLMLPGELDGDLELLYVGSVMGLLWQVRQLSTVDEKADGGSLGKTIIRKVFKK